jgi:SsrA-binding protein
VGNENEDHIQPILKNKSAYRDFEIKDSFEAGVVLRGTEVKSLRQGHASFTDAFAYMDRGEVWLRDMYIKPYEKATHGNHDPRRQRKLLLHNSEIRRIDKKINQKGYTLIPLRMYFREGYVKVEIALAQGKKKHDKRRDIAKKDAKREIERKVKGQYSVDL